MIDKQKIQEYVETLLADTDCYITDLKVSGDNDIVVEIDSSGMIDIDFCSALSRRIEEAFPRDEEDYTLEVGSAGLTSPFKVRKQWEKNVGNDIIVLTKEGKKLKGKLVSLGEESFKLESEQKTKRAGVKRPVIARLELDIPFSDVKSACYDLRF